MNIYPFRLEALRYQRAYRLTVDALRTLCCASGGMRERLKKIDPEFFTLKKNDLPEREDIRASFSKLHELVTTNTAKYQHEGRINATLDCLHHTRLTAITQLIFEIHTNLSIFMLSDDNTSH